LHLLQRVSRASASPTLGMSTGSIGPIGHDCTDTMAEPRSMIAARFVQQLHESPGQLQAFLAAPPLPAGEQRSKSTVWSDISCCSRPQHLSWGLSSSVQTRWVLSCRMCHGRDATLMRMTNITLIPPFLPHPKLRHHLESAPRLPLRGALRQPRPARLHRPASPIPSTLRTALRCFSR
jgi:hypothetical protein